MVAAPPVMRMESVGVYRHEAGARRVFQPLVSGLVWLSGR